MIVHTVTYKKHQYEDNCIQRPKSFRSKDVFLFHCCGFSHLLSIAEKGNTGSEVHQRLYASPLKC